MLLALCPGTPRATIADGAAIPPDAIWLDLVDPTDAERAAVQHATGLRVPALAEIAEIETSSRLRTEGQGLYLSMPVAAPGRDNTGVSSALGFVLSPHHLLTLRSTRLPVFDQFADHMAQSGADMPAVEVLAGLLEAMVDRLADLLEHVSADLDALSRRIFHPEREHNRRAKQEDLVLRSTLRRIGVAGDLTSILRASLLGINRVVGYAADAATFVPPATRPRFASMRTDIASLSEFDAQLTNKIQFLLDATLGFLNIQQNNGLRVLTVVSIVGIPPTLIASIYGMNFKSMPELGWQYGYPYGLTLIALSVIVPLVLFKLKGWL